MAWEPLAHSAREPGQEAQTYRAHIAGTPCSEGVIAGARRRATAMVAYRCDATRREGILNAVVDAATFHDLGKLDPDLQSSLSRGRGAKLCWDHVDAGVAHLRASRAMMAAWVARAHHAPGLPSQPVHFRHALTRDARSFRRLRGLRHDDGPTHDEHSRQIDRTDATLLALLAEHRAAVGCHEPRRGNAQHGLAMRLSLSCLVDADHADTAFADTRWAAPEPLEPRWPERLAALDAYVAGLGSRGGPRDGLRRRFYDACRHREPDQALMACEGPVGIGKTTAVPAALLRRAIATGARRLIIVAPYTAILSQTAARLRAALVLPDERDRPDAVVAEHHHRADFSDAASRDLAALWTAPIVLTTAVQFFETLSSHAPSGLRKLHALPGSVVFLDEAHAALPTPLWPQNWRWVCELADDWSCSFVLASGSLARFWTVDDIAGDKRRCLPDLAPPELVQPLLQAEAARVSYVAAGRFDGPGSLAEAVAAAPGPRLLIMNTVQSAAVMAKTMGAAGHDVLHLSTALCPRDRDVILGKVTARLEDKGFHDWTLVATSLMEAGVDLSFRTPFRERFATASLIQVGGRGNRNFEWPEGIVVRDFVVSAAAGLKAHPAALVPADVLAELFKTGRFAADLDPAELVTIAMRQEIRRCRQVGEDGLLRAEREMRYPDVARLGRVIDADTRLVVVDRGLRERILSRERVPTLDLLAGSVQIWAQRIRLLGLDPLLGRPDVFWWPHRYDPAFLGYMEGALILDDVASGEAVII